LEQLIDGHPMVGGDTLQDAGEQAGLYRVVMRDGFVMLSVALRGDADG